MGMGQPAHNLDNVIEAIDLLGSQGNIGHKNLVFSSVGDPRIFTRLAEGPVKPALALSRHTSTADLRERLLPRAPRLLPAARSSLCCPHHGQFPRLCVDRRDDFRLTLSVAAAPEPHTLALMLGGLGLLGFMASRKKQA